MSTALYKLFLSDFSSSFSIDKLIKITERQCNLCSTCCEVVQLPTQLQMSVDSRFLSEFLMNQCDSNTKQVEESQAGSRDLNGVM